MPLPRLSRLLADATKNLCAVESPVARVPVTPSAICASRKGLRDGIRTPARLLRPARSCGMSRGAPSGRKPAPTFSAGKTCGALSPPQQPIRPGRGAHVSSRRFSSRITGHRSRVTGRRSRAAGHCISPLQCAVTQKRACNSFAIRSYKSLDLKSPGMNSYKKYRGGGGLRVLQTLDLIHIFHCEGRIKTPSSAEVSLSSTVSTYPVPPLQASRPRPGATTHGGRGTFDRLAAGGSERTEFVRGGGNAKGDPPH